MTNNTSLRYTNFDGLINSNTSDFIMRDNELKASKNVWIYSLGRLEKVPGYDLMISDKVVDAESPNFLHWYNDVSTGYDYMLATSDNGSDFIIRQFKSNTLLWATRGTWSGKAGSKPDMENFLGRTFIVGHTSGTTYLENATINGTTYSLSDGSNLLSMPQGKFVVRYRDLLYVLHAYTGGTEYPSRAYFSDNPVGGSISWNNIATKFVEFGYDDGDAITGAVEALDRLVVFKSRSMWKYDENSREKISDFGCDSHRSIVKVNNIIYWFNRYGFWRWRGAEPELVSSKMQSFIDAIDQSKLDEVVGVRYNNFEYRAFIGDVTVDGIDYNNAWFCFDTRSGNSYIRCTYDTVKATTTFKKSNKVRAHFSNDNGQVFKFANKVDKIYADNGQEIDSFFITKAFDYGVPEDVKHVNHMTIFTKNGGGLKCAIDIDEKNTFDNVNITEFDNKIGHADITSSGNRFRYKFYEKSKSKSYEFEGFVIATDIKEHEE